MCSGLSLKPETEFHLRLREFHLRGFRKVGQAPRDWSSLLQTVVLLDANTCHLKARPRLSESTSPWAAPRSLGAYLWLERYEGHRIQVVGMDKT